MTRAILTTIEGVYSKLPIMVDHETGKVELDPKFANAKIGITHDQLMDGAAQIYGMIAQGGGGFNQRKALAKAFALITTEIAARKRGDHTGAFAFMDPEDFFQKAAAKHYQIFEGVEFPVKIEV